MTVERIDTLFRTYADQGKTALVAYLCVGDPSIEDTLACAEAALEAGADALELGVPFSDPTADGPVIAAAAYRAIANGGSLKAALSVARKIRARSDAPLILFSYYNPIVAFPEVELPLAAVDAGVDALLVVDLPPEEGAALRHEARQRQLGFVPLVAPTSDAEREASAFRSASGFVYYVSLTGVTGAQTGVMADAGQRANALRDRAGLPVVVGFGIDSADKARAVAEQKVSGVVVGTAIVRAIADGKDTADRVTRVKELVGELRRGLDSASA